MINGIGSFMSIFSAGTAMTRSLVYESAGVRSKVGDEILEFQEESNDAKQQ